MKTQKSSRGFAVLIVALLPLLAMGAGVPPDDGTNLDTGALAARLVENCAGVHEGDLVLVSGSPRDLRLLEDLAVRVREIGAYPIVEIRTDRMMLRTFERTPENILSRTDPFRMRIAEHVNAIIDIEYRESMDLLSGVPAAKLDATTRAERPVNETLLKRNVRMVGLGNDLYPTMDRARRYGITLDELSSIFWNGVNIDPERLRSAGQAVQNILAAGQRMHITKPNGTDLTVTIDNRQIIVSDGIISDEDVRRGGPACQLWLPAGEVYLPVVAGSATGKLVSDRFVYNGTEVVGLTVTFAKGKITGLTATSGVNAVKEQYGVGSEGKDLLSLIDIGINPGVTVPPGSSLLSWVQSGMVTVGIGNNSWTGGENSSSFALYLQIPGTTTTVDNTTLVDRGRLTVGAPLAEIPITTSSPDARKNYLKALQLAWHLRTIEARPFVEQAIAADPKFAMAYWLKSGIASTFAQSETSINQAIPLLSTVSEGERLLIEAAREALNGNTTREEALLRTAVDVYPEDKQALLVLARSLSGAQKNEEARAVLRRAIALDPEFAPAYNLLGYVNLFNGNLSEAQGVFKRYVELIPNEPNSHDSYAELLMKMGRYDESIEEYEKAISLDEQFYSAHIGLAYNYAFKGQFVDARRQLQMLDKEVTDDGVRDNLIVASAAIALHEGKYDTALEWANRGYVLATKINDTRAAIRYQTFIGDVTLEANAFDNTKRTYLKSRNAEPSKIREAVSHFTDARNVLAQTTLPDETRRAFEQALRAREVEVAIREDDIAKAKRIAEEYRTNALAQNTTVEIEKAHELAGIVASAEHRLQDAVTELNHSNLRDPRNLFRLMEVYEALGDKVMANDVRQRIVAFNETGVDYAFVRRMAIR